MHHDELNTLLHRLISTWENEVVEFKQASKDYSTLDIGKYFSALSNESNLRGIEKAWLVFGINNDTRTIVGSNYREGHDHLQSIKHQITQGTSPNVTFRDVHELLLPEGRVILFEIPAAPRGMPIAWQGHYYARSGESLTSLGLDKQDEIRSQTSFDWTAQIVPDASITDLDERALKKARESFALKHQNRIDFDDIQSWSNETFLERAQLTLKGKITRGTLLLLGKSHSAVLLNPNPAQITWRLEGQERGYEHFGPPFLLSTSEIYQKIRNVQIRLLPEDQLLAIEISKYDQKVVLEALHNCIAHQDYSRNGRVVLTEFPQQLELENEGTFFEGRPEDYLGGNHTPKRYRNPFLIKAMVELNMIDTMGYGIYSMHRSQAKRFFPMPDFDLSQGNAVKLTIYGKEVDPAYSRMLMQNTDLPFEDILALDRVQKGLSLDEESVKRLRKRGLVEGRSPKYFVAKSIAQVTGDKATYTKNRAFDKQYYLDLILKALDQHGHMERKDFDALLWNKLPEWMDDGQKKNKVSNLLTELRTTEKIKNVGSFTESRWVKF